MEPDKDYNLIVGLRIREVREAFHMSRAEFSERCDLSESFLAAVESGKKGVTSKTLYKICSTMNVSADYLIRGYRNGFEADALVELISSMDRRTQESAIRILREFADTIHRLGYEKEKSNGKKT